MSMFMTIFIKGHKGPQNTAYLLMPWPHLPKGKYS